MRILLVEDDQTIVEALTAILERQNYLVDIAMDGEAGWNLVAAVPYDLVLLDIMLPKLDGISFCRRLREQKQLVPVMLLTARDTTSDKLLGLDSGADDYVVKPFQVEELAARIRALLRRTTATPTSPVLSCQGLQLDPNNREVICQGQSLTLSRKEYMLLELFLRNQHRIFSRSAIVDQLWSLGEEPPLEDTVKSHVKSLRRKLTSAGMGDLIETLYGQGYRINPAYLVEATPEPPTPDPHPQSALDAVTAAIWQRTQANSLERLAYLEQVSQALQSDQFTDEMRRQATQNAHKLVGSLGTFGFDQGSDLARQIEGLLQSDLEAEAIAPQFPTLVAALRQSLKAPPPLPPDPTSTQSSALNPTFLAPSRPARLLIIDSDPELAQSLVNEAVAWEIEAVVAPNLATAQQQCRQYQPDVVVLDTDLDSPETTGYQFLQTLTRDYPGLPILVFSAQDGSRARIQAMKAGGQLFLQKPTPPAQVLQAIAEVLPQANQSGTKILAVDDDPTILLALQALLEPQGMQVTWLNQSTQFWETLKTVQPDLLILDINMPEIDGFELCQSVRRDFQWNWLPILLLTAQTGGDTLQRAFAVGADDYVTKPIVAHELATRVANRLKRSRLLRSQAEIDGLTGVANRQQAIQSLNQLIQLATHSQQPVCLAVLDLDHFKQINDQHGHIQGDRVLRQFGQFLKQKFRPGDVVARWGGEEFIVGMYYINREAGVERLAEVLEDWRSLASTPNGGNPLSVSFSAGIAQYPVDGTTFQLLYRMADAALYQAKATGRNRVLPVGWQSPITKPVQSVEVLLVQPQGDLSASILQAMETRGYHYHWLQSGRVAIELLKGNPPDLTTQVILLADDPPDLDALMVIQQLGSKRLVAMRVIVLPHQAERGEAALHLGAFDYLQLPCGIPALMQRLRRALSC